MPIMVDDQDHTHNPSPRRPPADIFHWFRSIGIAIEANTVSLIQNLLPTMKDDLVANGLTQWLFGTATIERLVLTVLIVIGFFAIFLIFRKQKLDDGRWLVTIILISTLVWFVLWIVAPYTDMLAVTPKAFVILLGSAGLALTFLPGRFSPLTKDGWPVASMIGILALIAFAVTSVIPKRWFSHSQPMKPETTPHGNPQEQVCELINATEEEVESFFQNDRGCTILKITYSNSQQYLSPGNLSPTPSTIPSSATSIFTSTSTPSPISATPTLTSTPTPIPTDLPTVAPAYSATSTSRCSYLDQSVPKNSQYVVRPGDNFSCIAFRAGVSTETLLAANEESYPSLAEQLDLILPGWVFYIP